MVVVAALVGVDVGRIVRLGVGRTDGVNVVEADVVGEHDAVAVRVGFNGTDLLVLAEGLTISVPDRELEKEGDTRKELLAVPENVPPDFVREAGFVKVSVGRIVADRVGTLSWVLVGCCDAVPVGDPVPAVRVGGIALERVTEMDVAVIVFVGGNRWVMVTTADTDPDTVGTLGDVEYDVDRDAVDVTVPLTEADIVVVGFNALLTVTVEDGEGPEGVPVDVAEGEIEAELVTVSVVDGVPTVLLPDAE